MNDKQLAILTQEMDTLTEMVMSLKDVNEDEPICTGGSRCGCDECFNERAGKNQPVTLAEQTQAECDEVANCKPASWGNETVQANPEALDNPLDRNWFIPKPDKPDDKPGFGITDMFKVMIGMK